jgi:hypothetical protein
MREDAAFGPSVDEEEAAGAAVEEVDEGAASSEVAYAPPAAGMR